MIDRLHQSASPLPPRPAAQESQAGAPSFLEWALSNPGENPGQLPGGQSGPGGQHAQPGQFLPVAATVPGMIDPAASLSPPGVIDPAATLLPRNLSGDPSQIPPPMRVPGELDPTQPVPGARAAGDVVPGGPTSAVSAVQDWQDASMLTLQMHLRKPQGEREVISLPWRLAPGGRLDQSLRGVGTVAPPGVVSPPMPGAGVSTTANIGLSAFGPPGGSQPGTLPPGVLAPGEGVLPPGMVRIAARGGDAPGAAAVGAASTPVVSEWLSRWMKWIERDGHDPVVLLRDYRMDGDETRRVVDTLRAFAREHGVALERVVVNGHEFWRNPDSRPHSNSTEE